MGVREVPYGWGSREGVILAGTGVPNVHVSSRGTKIQQNGGALQGPGIPGVPTTGIPPGAMPPMPSECLSGGPVMRAPSPVSEPPCIISNIKN